jgi:pantetheine-phosphate adenylyltransferase
MPGSVGAPERHFGARRSGRQYRVLMPGAMFVGSFDPVHLGHLGVIEIGSRLFDRLWVVVAGNPAKEHGLLSFEDRRDLIAACTEHLPTVEVLTHTGLLVELAETLDAVALIRSVGKERAYEFEMAHANACLAGISTVFVLPRRETWWISSRLVRERFNQGDLASVGEMVPPSVKSALELRASERT